MSDGEPIPKTITRRSFIHTVGTLGTLGAATLATGTLAELGTVVPDSNNSIDLFHGKYSRVAFEAKVGDHVNSLKETLKLIPKGMRCIFSGEITPDQVRIATENNPQRLTEENNSLKGIVRGFTGIGSSDEKAAENYRTLRALLEENTIITADTGVWVSPDLYDSFTTPHSLFQFSELLGATYSALNVGEAVIQKFKPNNDRNIPRRTVLKMIASGVSGVVVGGFFGRYINKGKIPSYVPTEAGTTITTVKNIFENKGIGILFGNEAEIISEVMVRQRSRNMLRNTEIASAIVNENADEVNGKDEQVPFFFKAGIGHSDIILDIDKTHEVQDAEMTECAHKIINTYLDLLALPSEKRPKNSDNKPLSNKDIQIRFQMVSGLGFGMPKAYGNISEIYKGFKIPKDIPKSAALIFIDTLHDRISHTTGNEQTTLITMLDSFMTISQQHYMNDEGSAHGLYPPALDELSLIPELHTPTQIAEKMTVLEYRKGKTLEELFTESASSIYHGMLPYAYVNEAGVPRVIYYHLTQDKQTMLFNGELMYGGVNAEGERMPIVVPYKV